jgi:hypothetical protein
VARAFDIDYSLSQISLHDKYSSQVYETMWQELLILITVDYRFRYMILITSIRDYVARAFDIGYSLSQISLHDTHLKYTRLCGKSV